MLLIATEDGGEMANEREREKQSRPGTKSAPKNGKECSLVVESVEVREWRQRMWHSGGPR